MTVNVIGTSEMYDSSPDPFTSTMILTWLSHSHRVNVSRWFTTQRGMRQCTENIGKAITDAIPYSFAFDYVQCKLPKEDQIESERLGTFFTTAGWLSAAIGTKLRWINVKHLIKVTELRPVRQLIDIKIKRLPE